MYKKALNAIALSSSRKYCHEMTSLTIFATFCHVMYTKSFFYQQYYSKVIKNTRNFENFKAKIKRYDFVL